MLIFGDLFTIRNALNTDIVHHNMFQSDTSCNGPSVFAVFMSAVVLLSAAQYLQQNEWIETDQLKEIIPRLILSLLEFGTPRESHQKYVEITIKI